MNEIARGGMHWAIPSEERLNLLVTMHHGHQQGEHKCKGDKAHCAEVYVWFHWVGRWVPMHWRQARPLERTLDCMAST